VTPPTKLSKNLSDDAKPQAGQRAEEQACQHNRGISWDRNVAAEFGPNYDAACDAGGDEGDGSKVERQAHGQICKTEDAIQCSVADRGALHIGRIVPKELCW
jgi:hypothetical protein